MDRRTFLGVGVSVAGAAAGGAALWFAPFFQPSPLDPPDLDAAFDRARAAGRALLIFVIPEDLAVRRQRGTVFGAWLNHGSPADLWPLARCEVACATAEDVAQFTGTGAARTEPWLVLIDPAVGPQSARAVEWEGPRLPSGALGDDAMRDWFGRLARALAAALPARLADHAEADESALAAAASARLRDGRVPGAAWAKVEPCGVEIEGVPEPSALGACGMSMCPVLSARFLWFYVDADRAR